MGSPRQEVKKNRSDTTQRSRPADLRAAIIDLAPTGASVISHAIPDEASEVARLFCQVRGSSPDNSKKPRTYRTGPRYEFPTSEELRARRITAHLAAEALNAGGARRSAVAVTTALRLGFIATMAQETQRRELRPSADGHSEGASAHRRARARRLPTPAGN